MKAIQRPPGRSNTICALSMNLRLVLRIGYKAGCTSTNKNIVTAERNSARKTLLQKSPILSGKKISEVIALLQRSGGRQSVVPTHENNEETLVNLFILN